MTIKEAVALAYERCVEAKGYRVEVHSCMPHVVVAYAVGQNIMRIDVRYAVRREWAPPEEKEGA